MGEGVVAVHDLGGEDGEDTGLVVIAGIPALLRRQLVHGEVADALLAQEGGHVGVEPVFDLHQAGDYAVDGLQLLHGGQPCLVVGLLRGDQAEVKEAPHPDHEKFVQVAGKDGNEFQPLQQRHGAVPRLLQHAAVKAEPAELTILGIGIGGVLFFLILRHNGSSHPPGNGPRMLRSFIIAFVHRIDKSQTF
jgi:hypothetical protein